MRQKKLSRIFFIIAAVFITLAFGLFVVHTYLGADFLRPTQNLLPPASHFLKDDVREFNVAVMSDTGSHNHVIERVIDDARSDENIPGFIMYLGDLVSDRRPANFYWMFREMGRHLNGMPFYMIPGNHDVEKRGNIDKRYYRAVVGPTYYWFGYGDTLFIAMDSSDVIEEEQFEWLAETLEFIRPLFRHCVLFGHMPPINPSDTERHRMSDPDAERFAAIVRGQKIDAMIFGHVHYFSTSTFAGIPIYTVPSSGQTPRFYDRGKYGYVQVQINKNSGVTVRPKYVEFSGPKREYLEAWFIRYIFTQRLREVINVILIVTAVFAIAGVIARRYERKS